MPFAAALMTLVMAAAPIPPPPAASGSVVVNPRLIQPPTSDELEKYYPALPHLLEFAGQVVVSCTVGADGAAKSCEAMAVSPIGLGFAAAAEKLAMTFRFSPRTVDGVPTEGLWRTKITFSMDGSDDPAPDNTPEASSLSPEALTLARQIMERLSFGNYASVAVSNMAERAREICTQPLYSHCDAIVQAVQEQSGTVSTMALDLGARMLASTYTFDELKAGWDALEQSGSRQSNSDKFLYAQAAAKAPVAIEAARRINFHLWQVALRRSHLAYCDTVGCPSMNEQLAIRAKNLN